MWKFHFSGKETALLLLMRFPRSQPGSFSRGWGRVSLLGKLPPLPCHSLRLKGFCHPLARSLQPAEFEDWSALSLRSNEKWGNTFFSGPFLSVPEFTAAWPPPYAHDYCSRWPQLWRRRNQDRGAAGPSALQALWRSSGSPLGGREDRVSLVLAALLTHRVRFCSGALVHDASKLNLKPVVAVDLQEWIEIPADWKQAFSELPSLGLEQKSLVYV